MLSSNIVMVLVICGSGPEEGGASVTEAPMGGIWAPLSGGEDVIK